MDHQHTEPTATPAGILTAPEQNDFDLIVANARTSGWISHEEDFTAERSAASIIVRNNGRERRYPDGQRWMYELLHDLAHGMWK